MPQQLAWNMGVAGITLEQPLPGGSYSVDHSAGTYIYDTQGRLRLFAGYGQGAPKMLHDIRLLLQKG